MLQPLSERELDELQDLLDRVPAPFEALDVSMLDGYLCGVLLQPRHMAVSRWLPHVTDVDGRALPLGFDSARLGALVLRRHAELDDAIQRRQWFDPLVFELSDGDAADAARDDGGDEKKTMTTAIPARSTPSTLGSPVSRPRSNSFPT